MIPKIERLVGNRWAINTSKLALGDADLDKGMEEIPLSDDLTRRSRPLRWRSTP